MKTTTASKTITIPEPEVQTGETQALTLVGKGYEALVSEDAKKLKLRLLKEALAIKVVNEENLAELRRVKGEAASFRITLKKSYDAVQAPVLALQRKIKSIADEFGLDIGAEEVRLKQLEVDYANAQERKRQEALEQARRAEMERQAIEREEAERQRLVDQEAERLLRKAEEANRRAAEVDARPLAAAKAQAAAEKAQEEARLQREASEREAAARKIEADRLANEANRKLIEAQDVNLVHNAKKVPVFEVEDIDLLYQKHGKRFVSLDVKTREIKEFLTAQMESGLPIGLPGLRVELKTKVGR